MTNAQDMSDTGEKLTRLNAAARDVVADPHISHLGVVRRLASQLEPLTDYGKWTIEQLLGTAEEYAERAWSLECVLILKVIRERLSNADSVRNGRMAAAEFTNMK